MNDFTRWVSAVEAVTGKKRGRHPVFNANQFYPHGVELELRKLTRDEFSRFLSECADAATIGFEDDLNEVSGVPEANPEDVDSRLGAAADKVKAAASADFVKWSEMLVGKPYFPPEARGEIFKTWKQNFQILCKSAKADIKKDISLTVQTAKNEGWNKERLRKEITSRLEGKYKARAENIARTELGKLNSAARLSQYKEVGIQYYRWLTTIDGRERQSHRAMNGLICSVSNPDVYYTENANAPLHPIEHSRTAEMFHGNPGEDFQCRCSMVAWDPEIDGMYEIKDPEAEAEAKAKAEEEAKHKAEAEAKAKGAAKFKEAIESLHDDLRELDKLQTELGNSSRYFTQDKILEIIDCMASEKANWEDWSVGDEWDSSDKARLDEFHEVAKGVAEYVELLTKHGMIGNTKLINALAKDAYYVGQGEAYDAELKRFEWKKLLKAEVEKGAALEDLFGRLFHEDYSSIEEAASKLGIFKIEPLIEYARDFREDIESIKYYKEQIKLLESQRDAFEKTFFKPDKKGVYLHYTQSEYDQYMAAKEGIRRNEEDLRRMPDLKDLESSLADVRAQIETELGFGFDEAVRRVLSKKTDAFKKKYADFDKMILRKIGPIDFRNETNDDSGLSRFNYIAKYAQDADNLLRGATKDLWRKLPKEAQTAATKYTRDSDDFNAPLKGFDTTWANQIGIDAAMEAIGKKGRKDIAYLDALMEASRTGQDMKLTRGADEYWTCGLLGIDESKSDTDAIIKRINEAIAKREELKELGYTSTAVSEGKGFDKKFMYRILAPKGTKGIYAEPFSAYTDDGAYETKIWDGVAKEAIQDEMEMLLARNTTYRMVGCEKEPRSGKIVVTMVVVAQD